MRYALAACLCACTSAASEPVPTAASASAATATAVESTVVSHPSASAEPQAVPAPLPAPARIAFMGDLCMGLEVGIHLDMVAQNKRASLPKSVGPGYPFAHVAERLRGADFLVGNLECVLSLRGERATDHNPFRCSMSSPAVLQAAGFDLVSVANNHAMDYGGVAFKDMLANLDAARMPHFGKETFAKSPEEPVIRELGGTRVGLLAYYWPPDLPLRDVAAARPKVDVLIAFMHWGTEDQPEPMEMQRKLARDFVDAGVDLVVGTHAHVLQPTAWYKGKFIAYGLGNSVFSGMMQSELHRTGAVLEVEVAGGKIAAHRMIRTLLEDDGAPHWLDDPESAAPILPGETPAYGDPTRRNYKSIAPKLEGRLKK